MASLKPTEYQKRIATLLGIDISADSQGVAAARIQEVVEPAIDVNAKLRSATPRQTELAKWLGIDVSGDSFFVAYAKIADKLPQHNRMLIEKINLKPGDKVVKIAKVEIEGVVHDISREYVVSSIGGDGRIYFKGGNGWGAWPHEINKLPQKKR